LTVSQGKAAARRRFPPHELVLRLEKGFTYVAEANSL